MFAVLAAAVTGTFALITSQLHDQATSGQGHSATSATLLPVGRWHGIAQQDDEGKLSQYGMSLILTGSADDGNTAYLHEQITSGGCVPTGSIVITRAPGGHLGFRWSGVTPSGLQEAVTAELAPVS